MMFLLDVNALIAMQYQKHVHHARVDAWASQLCAKGGEDQVVFATCPITELGFQSHGGHPATLDGFIPGAVFIPDETRAPLVVRDAGSHSVWAAPLRTGHAAH